MGLTLHPPLRERTLPAAMVTVAAATDPYTAPPLQVWRTVRHDPTPPAAGQAGAAGQADIQAGGHPDVTVDPATAPTLQVWHIASPEPVPVSLAADTPVTPCGPHSPAIADPYTAPTLQVWRTAGHNPAPPADGQAVPCGPGTPPGTLEAPLGARSDPSFPINTANRHRFASAIQQVAVTYHLEPALLHAVISAESGYDPQARSPKGARGLMQLMPATAQRFGVSAAADPTANLQGGARYLRWLLDLFKDLRLALAAYNAGEGAVQRYGNTIPPYQETRTYIRRVLEFYQQYRRVP